MSAKDVVLVVIGLGILWIGGWILIGVVTRIAVWAFKLGFYGE